MAKIGFKTSDYEPNAPLDAVPAGDYPCTITDAALKPTKRGDGEYVMLVHEVADGEFKGRKIFDRLNIHNPNKTAEAIGRRQLSSLAAALNLPEIDDTDILVGAPVTVRVTVRSSAEYGDQNDVKAYLPREQAAAPKPAARPAAQRGGVAPWRENAA